MWNQPSRGLLTDAVRQVVRPYRPLYDCSKLGPAQLSTHSRTDFYLENKRGERLASSLYRSKIKSAKIIIFLHGNSGSRVDFLSYETGILAYQVDVLTFDFSGSGLSDGDLVTLGIREKEDLLAVYEHVLQHGYSEVYLAGRSMGAVTAVLFLHSYPSKRVDGLILDSPFINFEDVFIEAGVRQTKLPRVVVSLVLMMLKAKIRWDHGLEIAHCSLEDKCGSVTCPTVLIYSQDDQLIPSCHSARIRDGLTLATAKKVMIVKGSHNDPRPVPSIVEAVAFAIGVEPAQVRPKESFFLEKNSVKRSFALDFRKSKQIKGGGIRLVESEARPRQRKEEEEARQPSWLQRFFQC